MARQVFISPVIEAASIKRPTYNMMKDALTTWAKNHGGQVQYLRGLTSGDMLLQLDQNVMTYLRDNYFPEIDLHLLGCWQPKPSHQDTSVPSVVVEGVDRFLSHRAVVEKLKDPENATWLGVQPETLQAATHTYVRFHRKVDGSAPEPTSTGRLVGPPEIITRMAQKTGIYVGYPCYVREFAQQEKWKTGNRTMEVDSMNRGAKRNTEEREREEADEMITPSREAEQPHEPSSSRRRTETPPPIDLTTEENQSTTEAPPDQTAETPTQAANPPDRSATPPPTIQAEEENIDQIARAINDNLSELTAQFDQGGPKTQSPEADQPPPEGSKQQSLEPEKRRFSERLRRKRQEKEKQ